MKLLTATGLTKLIEIIKSSFVNTTDIVETEETSLKTINGQSILGEGDITISGGASSFAEITGQPTDNDNLAAALNAKYDSTNPSGYQTSAQVSTAITTATSSFITKDVNNLTNYTKTSNLATVATSGSYNDLSNLPTIPTVPTNVSDFTNDVGYQTSTQVSNTVSTAVTNKVVLRIIDHTGEV